MHSEALLGEIPLYIRTYKILIRSSYQVWPWRVKKSPIESRMTSAMEKGRPDSIHAAKRRETESVTNGSTTLRRVKASNSVSNPILNGYRVCHSAVLWSKSQQPFCQLSYHPASFQQEETDIDLRERRSQSHPRTIE